MEMQGKTVKRATCNKVANLVVFVGLWMHAHLLLAAFTIEVLLYVVVDFSKQDLDLNPAQKLTRLLTRLLISLN